MIFSVPFLRDEVKKIACIFKDWSWVNITKIANFLKCKLTMRLAAQVLLLLILTFDIEGLTLSLLSFFLVRMLIRTKMFRDRPRLWGEVRLLRFLEFETRVTNVVWTGTRGLAGRNGEGYIIAATQRHSCVLLCSRPAGAISWARKRGGAARWKLN